MVTPTGRLYGERRICLPVGVAMVCYVFLVVVAAGFVAWIVQSPVTRALLGGRGTDPGQFGTAAEHLEDIGLGVSWRSDGRGGQRESKILSKHTRRRR